MECGLIRKQIVFNTEARKTIHAYLCKFTLKLSYQAMSFLVIDMHAEVWAKLQFKQHLQCRYVWKALGIQKIHQVNKLINWSPKLLHKQAIDNNSIYGVSQSCQSIRSCLSSEVTFMAAIAFRVGCVVIDSLLAYEFLSIKLVQLFLWKTSETETELKLNDNLTY